VDPEPYKRGFVIFLTKITDLLRTDPRDVGCARAMEVLHLYADLMLSAAESLDGFAGVIAHLQACGSCSEDFDGLLRAVIVEQRRSLEEMDE
jgi:hypothetical protein